MQVTESIVDAKYDIHIKEEYIAFMQ